MAKLKRPNASKAFNTLVEKGVITAKKGRFGSICSLNKEYYKLILSYENDTYQTHTTVSNSYVRPYEIHTHNIKLPIQKHIYVDTNKSDEQEINHIDDANASSQSPKIEKQNHSHADNQKRFIAIAELFNQVFADTQSVRKVSLDAKATNKKRLRLIPSAWNIAKHRVQAWVDGGQIQEATGKDCLHWFEIYFKSCAGDPFINGETRSKGHENWKPSFEYLMRADVIEQRVMERV